MRILAVGDIALRDEPEGEPRILISCDDRDELIKFVRNKANPGLDDEVTITKAGVAPEKTNPEKTEPEETFTAAEVQRAALLQISKVAASELICVLQAWKKAGC